MLGPFVVVERHRVGQEKCQPNRLGNVLRFVQKCAECNDCNDEGEDLEFEEIVGLGSTSDAKQKCKK